MEIIIREYTVDSHNDLCATGICLGNILTELLGSEYVHLTGFINQTIMPEASASVREDFIGVKLDGYYLARDKQGGYVSHSGYVKPDGAWSDEGTGRKICNVWVDELVSGHYQKPYTYRIGLEWESKEDFIAKAKLSTSFKNVGDVVQWHEIEIGDTISTYAHPDGPTLIVDVTAMGRSKFLAIPRGFSDEEIAYDNTDDWRHC